MFVSRRFLFGIMCGIWGLTWIAIKIGVRAVPPFFFAASRLLVGGTILAIVARATGKRAATRGLWPRIVLAALLVNTAAYGCLFWGMKFVPSGLSAVLNLSLIPVSLFAIGLAANEETFSYRKLFVLGLGIAGLGILFLPKLVTSGEGATLAGMVAIVAGEIAYSSGSVLSRPLLRGIDTTSLASLHNLIGGAGLVILSAVVEPVGPETFTALIEPRVLASWMFLSLGGTVMAFTIYLTLLRDWGPSRAGTYAFVSPIVAVVVGVALYREPFGLPELVGSSFMLLATALAIRRPGERTRGVLVPGTAVRAEEARELGSAGE